MHPADSRHRSYTRCCARAIPGSIEVLSRWVSSQCAIASLTSRVRAMTGIESAASIDRLGRGGKRGVEILAEAPQVGGNQLVHPRARRRRNDHADVMALSESPNDLGIVIRRGVRPFLFREGDDQSRIVAPRLRWV